MRWPVRARSRPGELNVGSPFEMVDGPWPQGSRRPTLVRPPSGSIARNRCHGAEPDQRAADDRRGGGDARSKPPVALRAGGGRSLLVRKLDQVVDLGDAVPEVLRADGGCGVRGGLCAVTRAVCTVRAGLRLCPADAQWHQILLGSPPLAVRRPEPFALESDDLAVSIGAWR